MRQVVNAIGAGDESDGRTDWHTFDIINDLRFHKTLLPTGGWWDRPRRGGPRHPSRILEQSSEVPSKFRNRSEGLLPAGVRPVVNARQATGPLLGGAGGMRDADRGGPAGRQGRADGRVDPQVLCSARRDGCHTIRRGPQH